MGAMKVVALAGGVGGAKLAHGLEMCLPSEDLSVIVNTGDDFEHLGLTICPDLDTVTYTLAGLANPDTGWGVAGDTFEFLDAMERLGAPSWFRLGDRDLAIHVERTRRLRSGETLTEVTGSICRVLGVKPAVLPMADEPMRTMVESDEGILPFQDYFVRRRCEPRALGFEFRGAARLAGEARRALEAADLVVFCPSNQFVSIGPILALPGVRELIRARPAVAVSPIVGGEALRGPAAKMMLELGHEVSALGVARAYAGLIAGLVIDQADAGLAPEIEALGMRALVTGSVMRSDSDRRRLAAEVIEFGSSLRAG
jgi:LPPG:FO 2-phospho-L-lactate transferase